MSKLFLRILSRGALPLVCATMLTAQSAPQSIPLEITHGKPYVKVTINGQGPFRFVIDTGTGAEAFVTPQLAQQLNLAPAGHVQLGDPSGLGKQKTPLVMIDSLDVGGVEFSGIKAVEHVLSDDDGSVQGLLGFVLFRKYLLTLDFPKHRLTLAQGSVSPDEGHSVLPFRMPDGIPIIPLRIGGLEVEGLLDSGGTGLSLPDAVATRLKWATVPTLFGNSRTLSTRFEVKAATLDGDISLAGYTFARPFVEINPAFPLANIGSCPMQDFAFTFDQENRLVRIESGRRTIHLSAAPAALRPTNAPPGKVPDPMLVPVG
jgi:predicted aspartyl protease